MAEPQVTTKPQETSSTTGRSTLPAVQPENLGSVVENSLNRAEQACVQYRFDVVRVAAEARKNQPGAPLLAAHASAAVKRLDAVLGDLAENPERPAAELHAARWKAVSYFALLRAFDPDRAEGFSTAVGQQARALVTELEKSLADPTIESLDRTFRESRILYEFAPAPENAAAGEILKSTFAKTLELPAQDVLAYIDQTEQSTTQYLSDRSGTYQRELRQTLEAAKKEPQLADEQWRLLGPLLRERNGALLYRSGDGKEWNVEAMGSTNVRRANLSQVVFRAVDDPSSFLTFDSETLTRALRERALDAPLQKAFADSRDRALSARSPARTELVLDPARTLVLSVHPAANNDVITNGGFGSLLLARALKESAAVSLIVSDSPVTDIRATLDAQVRAMPGLRDVVLDLNQHGSPSGLMFAEPITGETLIKLATSYPKLRFHVSTIACNGGGLHRQLKEQLERRPDLRDRVSLFTQTKVEAKNILSFSTPERDSTSPTQHRAPLQQLLLIKGLLDDPTNFGRAFHQSDERARAIVPLDGEAIIRGVPLSQRALFGSRRTDIG